MSKGKREAVGGGWHKGGDPFAEESAPKKQKKAKTPKEKTYWRARPVWQRALMIGGGTVAVLALVLAVAFALLVRKPNVETNNRPNSVNLNPGKTDNDAVGDDTEGPEVLTGRKEDYFTFLLLGKDTYSNSTDTIILVSYDVPNQQVNMMSIPRDTAVNVSWSTKKINSVNAAKESRGGGIENLKQQVANLTGVMPDFYVIIEWKAVGRVVDAVGGVDFYVPRNMDYDDSYQDLHIHLKEGQQTLTGQKAMEMLRYRTGNRNSNGVKVGYDDDGRMNTQREFLKAMAKKVLQLGNITKIGEFIDIFMENVETDLKLSDLTWFASKAIGMNADSIQTSTMPYFDVGMFHEEWYFLPDLEEILPLINEQFNPYNQDITEEDLHAIVRNKDGSCYVTNGTLLDASWGRSYSGSLNSTSSGGVTTGTTPSGNSGGGDDDSASQPSSGQNNTTTANPSGSGTTTNSNGAANSGGTTSNTAKPGETGDPAGTEPGDDEPNLPDEPNTGTEAPSLGTEEPSGGAEDPGGEPGEPDEEEPLLPGEPSLPDEGTANNETGNAGDMGAASADPAESGGDAGEEEVNDEPPGWV